MSDLRNCETAKDAGHRVIWWLVTYLFYVLACFFTFTTAFPKIISRANYVLVDLVILVIVVIFVILILSIFIFRKFLILLNCAIMFLWLAGFFIHQITELPDEYRIGGADAMRTQFRLFLIFVFPAFLFVGLTFFRMKKLKGTKLEIIRE